MVGRYFELVVLFWLVPLYVITRGFYTGYVDGFVTRAFGKVWGFIWALVLAKIVAHYVSAEINVTACDRVYSFFSLWLLSFTSIHGCGVYIAKKYALDEKIHSWLEDPRWGYARWKRIDQALGGTVEALVLLGLAFFIVVNILTSFNQNVTAIPHYTPLNFAAYALYYPILHLTNVASALNLTGPGAFGVKDYLQHFAAGNPDPLRYCNSEQISHAPYAWTGLIAIAITGPLAFVICFQPVLHSPLWLSDLRQYRFGPIRLAWQLQGLCWTRNSYPQSTTLRNAVRQMPRGRSIPGGNEISRNSARTRGTACAALRSAQSKVGRKILRHFLHSHFHIAFHNPHS